MLQAIDAGRASREQTIAGYFLEGDILNVYLLDGADAEAVRAEVEAALGDVMPSGGVRLSRLDSPPDDAQFEAWVDELRGLIWSAEGIIVHSGTGGCCNIWDRVHYSVGTAYSAHLLREVVARTSVPQEAVFVEVSARPKIEEPSTGQLNVGTTVEFSPEIERGMVLRMDVVWTNLGEEAVDLLYSPVVPANLVVFSPDGGAVWASHDGGPIFDIGASANLAPGEELRFSHHWDLSDEDGFALPPGDYLVQAQTDVSDLRPERAMVSELYPLRIEP